MDYRNQSCYNVIDDRPMLGSVEDYALAEVSNDDQHYNSKYNEEVNLFLDEANEELYREKLKTVAENIKLPEHVHNNIPKYWYQDMSKNRIKEAKNRLENLSTLACYTCDSIGAYIKRIEQDHGTTFCKMDYSPRHPPLNKPWTNTWKFNCTVKCRVDERNHTHSIYCESIVFEHADQNISQNEIPNYVEDAVKLFEDFGNVTMNNILYSNTKEVSDITYQKSIWTGLKLIVRSNCHNELMIIIRGKKINSLIPKLRSFFKYGPERNSHVISVFCIDQTWTRKKHIIEPENITGLFKLKDNLGPLSIEYKPKMNVDFNAVEAIQLGKIIHEYAGLTKETTLLDIGCNFGVLSLMMSLECETVIGINTMYSVNSEIVQAEELKKFNKIHNVSFISCSPENLLTNCSPFIKQCITVAVLNLSSPYGKSKHVVQALRNLPSIWRVIVYGSFAKEFHRNINTLITEDHTMGECFLPMQGCILEKSPSGENAFDIIIVFERKSLITPKIELTAAGPTLNMKVETETYDYGSLDTPDIKPKLHVDIYQEFKYSRKTPKEKSPSPSNAARRFDYPRHERIYSPNPSSQKDKDRHNDRSMSKEWKPLTIPKEERPPSRYRNRSPSMSDKEKSFDHSVSSHRCRDNQPPLPNTSLLVKNEFQFIYPPPPLERFPSPPPLPPLPPPTETSLFEKDYTDNPPLTIVKAEPMRLYKDIEGNVLIPAEKGISRVDINSEPTNQIPSLIKVKSEPPDSYGSPAQLENIKSESKDMEICLNTQDIMYMETPIHNPRAFSGYTHSPSLSVPSSVGLDGSELPVQTNLTYLSIPENNLFELSQIKKEKHAYDAPLITAETEDIEVPQVVIKSEPIDSSFSEIIDANVPLPITIKSEPVDSQEILYQPMSVPDESGDMEILLNSQDIRYIETPIHNPRALSDSQLSPPIAVSTNVSINDSEPPIQTNLSYLSISKNNLLDTSTIKQEKDAGDAPLATNDNEIPRVTIKPEPVESSSSEINVENVPLPITHNIDSIHSLPLAVSTNVIADNFDIPIQANLSVKCDPEQPNVMVNVKTEPGKETEEVEIIIEKKKRKRKDSQPKIRVKSVDEIIKVKTELKEHEDLRSLQEQRQAILQELDQETEGRDYTNSHGRSSSSDLYGTYRWHSLSSPSIRKYRRSPSPRRRSIRSPSPKRYNRSPYRHRSPNNRRSRRSPSTKRSRRSPSPNERRRRRSPSTPTRFKKEPLSPVSNRREERNRRSPFFNKREVYGRTKSPINSHRDPSNRRSRSKSPSRG